MGQGGGVGGIAVRRVEIHLVRPSGRSLFRSRPAASAAADHGSSVRRPGHPGVSDPGQGCAVSGPVGEPPSGHGLEASFRAGGMERGTRPGGAAHGSFRRVAGGEGSGRAHRGIDRAGPASATGRFFPGTAFRFAYRPDPETGMAEGRGGQSQRPETGCYGSDRRLHRRSRGRTARRTRAVGRFARSMRRARRDRQPRILLSGGRVAAGVRGIGPGHAAQRTPRARRERRPPGDRRGARQRGNTLRRTGTGLEPGLGRSARRDEHPAPASAARRVRQPGG